MLVVDTVFISAVLEPFRRRATRRSQIGQQWTFGEVRQELSTILISPILSIPGHLSAEYLDMLPSLDETPSPLIHLHYVRIQNSLVMSFR